MATNTIETQYFRSLIPHLFKRIFDYQRNFPAIGLKCLKLPVLRLLHPRKFEFISSDNYRTHLVEILPSPRPRCFSIFTYFSTAIGRRKTNEKINSPSSKWLFSIHEKCKESALNSIHVIHLSSASKLILVTVSFVL